MLKNSYCESWELANHSGLRTALHFQQIGIFGLQIQSSCEAYIFTFRKRSKLIKTLWQIFIYEHKGLGPNASIIDVSWVLFLSLLWHSFEVVRANLTRGKPPNSNTGGSRLIFSVPLSYFLLIFYLPRCTLPDFPSVSPLTSLPFLPCIQQEARYFGGNCTVRNHFRNPLLRRPLPLCTFIRRSRLGNTCIGCPRAWRLSA